MILEPRDRVTVSNRGIAVYKPKPRIIATVLICLLVEAAAAGILYGCYELAKWWLK